MATPSKFREVLDRNKTLADCYVYYKRLETDIDDNPQLEVANRNLIKAITDGVQSVGASYIGAQQSVGALRRMAKSEAQKEQQLINTVFNTNIVVDWNDKTQVKSLIDTYNSCLNLKEVYERNLFLIKNSDGMKGVFSFFATYFSQVWDEKWPHMAEDIAQHIDLNKPQEAGKYIGKVIDDNMSDIIVLSLERMFSAKNELKSMPEEMRNAYNLFLSKIGDLQTAGSLAQKVYKAYNLDKVKEYLVSKLTGNDFKKLKKGLSRSEIENSWNNKGSQQAGIFFEHLVDAIQGEIGRELAKNKNIRVENFHPGSYGATSISADNIMSIGIDPALIEETLGKARSSGMKKHIEAFNELGEKLSNLKDGFLIYTTDKNYTLNKKFETYFGGYGAKNISARTTLDVLAPIVKNARTLVGMALQLGEGALAKENGLIDEEVLSQMFAKQIAYFLFDDHQTIGEIQRDVGARSIHMMDMNGVMIPLSFFISLLADSIQYGIMNPKKIAQVKFHAPKILFPTMAEQKAYTPAKNDPGSAWRKQKEYALDETKIEFRFLGGLRDILKEYV